MDQILPTLAGKSAPVAQSFVSSLYLLKKQNERTANDKAKIFVTSTIAILFWLYALTKTFAFDIDLWLIRLLAPSGDWVLAYKLVGFLSMLAVLWIWLGTRNFFVFLLYITFYPFKILFYKLPLALGKMLIRTRSWVLALAITNAAVSTWKHLKFNFIVTTCFIVFALIALRSGNPVSLFSAAAAILVLLLIAYVRGFLLSLSSGDVFRIYASALNRQDTTRYAPFALDTEIRSRSREELAPDQLEKWNEGLERSVVYNRACLFAAKRLRDYQRSPWPFLPAIFGILKLAAYTVLSFLLISFALWKIDPALYTYSKPPSLFTFGYFSFNALLLNGIDDLKPVQTLSQSTFMVQECLSFLLVAIFISMVFTQRAQQASSDLDQAIANAEREAASVEVWIKSEYQIASVQTAMEHLQDAGASLAKFIYWLSKGI